MFFRKKYLLAKVESVYGTDPVLDNTNGIITSNLQISPYEGNRVSLDRDRAYLGNDQEINTGPRVVLEFDVEVAGGGAVDTPPPYADLLLACGFAETVNAAVDVQYDLISEAFQSATLYFWIDGQRHKVTGARGTMSVNLQREQIPYFHFRMEGFYSSPTAQASVDPTFAGFQDPLAVIDANTSLTLAGQSVKTEQFSAELSNQVAARFLINGDEVVISDRQPACTFLFEAPDIGTYDFFADLESHAGVTLIAATVTHGTVAGNIVEFSLPTIQLSQMALQESDGIVAYNAQGMLIPTSAGNDEFKITTK